MTKTRPISFVQSVAVLNKLTSLQHCASPDVPGHKICSGKSHLSDLLVSGTLMALISVHNNKELLK